MALSIYGAWSHLMETFNVPRTSQALAQELAASEAEVLTVLQAGLPAPNQAFLFDGALYYADSYYVPSEMTTDDQLVIDALAAAICNPTSQTCKNDITEVLNANGWSRYSWARYNANLRSLVDIISCANLRDRVVAAGLDGNLYDTYLINARQGCLINETVQAASANPGV